MSDTRYRYELRRGEVTVATGHVALPEPVGVGDRVRIGALDGIVRTVEPLVGELELRLIVQLLSGGSGSAR